MRPEALVALWTWITFGAVSFILYKVAWKPILAALDAREAGIRNALDDAEAVREKLATIDETKSRLIQEAEEEAKRIIADARTAAGEAGAQVEKRAAEKVSILYENAERDIATIKEKTVAVMQSEQAEIVINLAGRLVEENLDDDKNRALTDKMLDEW
jgi:F-type H+-transporting ATPase subunit b